MIRDPGTYKVFEALEDMEQSGFRLDCKGSWKFAENFGKGEL